MGDVARETRDAVARALSAVRTRAAVPFWIAGAAVIAVLVGVIATGGLERAEATPVQLGPGETAQQSLYSVTVLDAELTEAIEDQYLEADPGETILVVTLRLENHDDHAIGVGRDADRVDARLISSFRPLITLSDVEPTRSPQVWRDGESSNGAFVQPGVPTEVRVAWTVPDDAFPDGVARIDAHEVRISTGQILLSSEYVTWRPTDVAARITVPLEGAS